MLEMVLAIANSTQVRNSGHPEATFQHLNSTKCDPIIRGYRPDATEQLTVQPDVPPLDWPLAIDYHRYAVLYGRHI